MTIVDMDQRMGGKEKNDAFLVQVDGSGELEEPKVTSKIARVNKVKQSKRKVEILSVVPQFKYEKLHIIMFGMLKFRIP